MKYTRQWSQLDNAAKIFPATSTLRDTKVFRFACELEEEVDPAVLQSALDRTMEKFPFYRSVLKRGLFWYYFESSGRKPWVHKESRPPCSALYSSDRKDLLFDVTYFRRRINLEVYHALSDGTGALHFLRMLVYYYLAEKHADALEGRLPAFDYDASEAQKRDDSFSRYYSRPLGRKGEPEPKAHLLRGERLPDHRLGVVEGRLSVKALLQKSHEHGATLSELLTAALILAIREGMSVREEARPVVITIPVNLRKYFPSESARNFFGVINVGYHFGLRDGTFEDVIAEVRRGFREQLEPERLRARMNKLSALEHSIPGKVVPVALKNPGMKVANWMAERHVTAAFSNVGRVPMPEELAPYIRLFDVFTSTKRLQACMCSFRDNFMVSFTSPFLSADIERAFFRRLTAMGLAVEVTTNRLGRV